MSFEEKKPTDLLLIDYLKSLLTSEEVSDFEDIGFCYWNISDNYAFIRDGDSLFENHRVFHEHVRGENPCYLYWLVCDATQRFALENSGYSEFWQSLYREAVVNNIGSDICFAEFAAHRAALTVNPNLRQARDDFEFAKMHFEEFLHKSESTEEYSFYRIIYLSLMSRFIAYDKIELKNLCKSLLGNFTLAEITDDSLTGEWKRINTPFNKRKQAVVGINSAINAFIHSGEAKIAKEIYSKACNFGMNKNDYIEKRLK